MSEKKHIITSNHTNNPFFPSPHGPTLAGVAALLSAPTTRNIIILAGAGISTSAEPPIPDFRSPGTGLYSNLASYNLPYAEAIFDIAYFQRHPQPFFTLAKHLYPGNFKPALAHYFLTLLQSKGKLKRVFTQNVDTLERIAGVEADKVVEAHGSFASSTCIVCKHRVDDDWIRAKVEKGQVARCPRHKCPARRNWKAKRIDDHDEGAGVGVGGLVKPDIVFFGESLPSRFFTCIPDLKTADLLIVMGTSLQVQPFASLIDAVPQHCPRVLINLERVGELASSDGYEGGRMGTGMYNETGFDFDGLAYGGKHNTRDVFYEGKADDGIIELVKLIGEDWENELNQLKQQGYNKLDADKPKDTIPVVPAKPKTQESSKATKDSKSSNANYSSSSQLANPTIREDTNKLDQLTRDLETKANIHDESSHKE
ncbi:related to NAD-dependent histone deacetylase [Melanopsichium pennsylvanicum]|uniref:NAD-dependent protein deacetylase n=2 Tax=Melanopsichium pennsylvanicum TaxID=63383 RepID=A0AAJ4XMA5_9BASI|nr:related to NAD-dependent histone deacetylase [Melanopsichium pennsylvanicum 4]SNX83663.1 related to NAD-dependent histone deacetylase [Melanopsichium pennsylvanicum]